MKIFMTGASGYLGNALVMALLKQGHEINILVRPAAKRNFAETAGLHLYSGDLLDKNSVTAAMKGCEQVYHVAAYARLWSRNRDTFYTVNVKGTYNVLTAAAENNVARLVYTSSAGVLGGSLNVPLTESDPRIEALTNDYDLSKHMAEELVRSFAANGLNAVIVNPTRVYGPGPLHHSNAISRMLAQFLNGHFSWAPACPNVVANYTFIDDVVKGHLLAMEKGQSGERYILGGENTSYAMLYQLIEELTGRKVTRRIPVWLMKTAGYYLLLRYRLTGIEPEFTPESLSRLFRNAELSNEKAVQDLGYRITPLKTGLKRTIESLKIKIYD